MNRAVKIVLLAAFALLVALFAFVWRASRIDTETVVHAARVDWLPATATDISSSRDTGWGNTHAYEFRIARADFESLARERGWAVKPIDKPVSIVRYVECLRSAHPEAKGPGHAMSSAGLYYEDRRANGGGLTVLYDDASSMAYVFTSSR